MKKYFNRLSILQKISICGVIFALPIFLLLFYMVSGFNREIEFARLELAGCRVLAPSQTLARLVPEFQLFSRIYAQGDTAVEGKVTAIAKEIEKEFATLQNEAKGVEELLRISEKSLKEAGVEQGPIKDIYEAWQSSSSKWKDLSWNNDFTNRVLKPIHDLIKRLGNTSNMVLDPYTETYYMIDAAFLKLERNQQKLGEFLLFAESVIYKGFRNRQDTARFITFGGMLEEDLAHIQESFRTAMQENNKIHGADTTLQKSIPPLIEEYKSAILPLLFLVNRFANDQEFQITAPQLAEPVKELSLAGSKLRETSMAEIKALLEERIESITEKRFIALFLSLGTLLLASIIAFFVSRGITHSLGSVIDVAGEIASGDLRKAKEDMKRMGRSGEGGDEAARRGSRNEIERLFGAVASMISSLHSLLAQVGKSGIQVTSSSAEIAASARELEGTVAEQASSVQEVSATSREISAASQEFTTTMKKVAEMASKAADLASHSMAGLGDINTTMKNLLEGTTESSGKLRAVGEKMNNITQVITTITKVANQINLLSLNAAIEAEKAGEHGIGFSVVAREIRRLADQTAVSALDIEGLIVETQEAMREGVAAVEAYTVQTRTSTERIAEISVDFLRAIEHTQQLVPQFESVNQGMQVQSQSATQISETMTQLSEAAAQTRDALLEFREATAQLNEAVRDLQNEVSRFKVGE